MDINFRINRTNQKSRVWQLIFITIRKSGILCLKVEFVPLHFLILWQCFRRNPHTDCLNEFDGIGWVEATPTDIKNQFFPMNHQL